MLVIIFSWLLIILGVLLSVAFFTLLERQILAALQRRQGPNVVGFYGLLQPITDGVKLILKETVIPRSSDTLVFIFAPIFTFALALCLWVAIPFNSNWKIVDFNYGILYLFTVSSLSVHSVIMAGWSSNSKYAFLGALRSAAQMISYEVSFGIIIVNILFLSRSLNFIDIVEAQLNVWNAWLLFPMFIIFFICILAETNRHPFDLPEAESELVSGYNVEYAAVGFALFFLAEYSNMIVMSVLTVLLFLGGWLFFFSLPVNILGIFLVNIIQLLFFVFKIMIFVYLFVLVRGTLPRYRYDQLMRLGWKIFLPITLGYVIFIANLLYTTDSIYNFNYTFITENMFNLNTEWLLTFSNNSKETLDHILESKHLFYNYQEFLESDIFYKLQYGETKRDVMFRFENPFNSSKDIVITNGLTYLGNDYCEFIDKWFLISDFD